MGKIILQTKKTDLVWKVTDKYVNYINNLIIDELVERRDVTNPSDESK